MVAPAPGNKDAFIRLILQIVEAGGNAQEIAAARARYRGLQNETT